MIRLNPNFGHRWPLRHLVPALILAITLGVAILAYHCEVHAISNQIEKDAQESLTFEAASLAHTLDYFFSIHKPEWVEAKMAEMRADPEVGIGLVADEHDVIIAAGLHRRIGRPVATRLNEIKNERGLDISASLKQVHTHRVSSVIIAPVDNLVVALYPVNLGAAPGELQAPRIGTLILTRDLSGRKAEAREAVARHIAWFAIPMLGIAVGALAYFFLFINRRVKILINTTQEYELGNFSARAGLNGQDELAKISSAIDQMANTLGNAHRKLIESEAKFSAIFRQASTLILIQNESDGTYLEVNDQVIETTGYSHAEIEGLTPKEVGWFRSDPVSQLQQLGPQKTTVAQTQIHMTAKSGAPLVILFSSELIMLNGRQCILSVGIDVTGRKQLEESVNLARERLDFALEISRIGAWELDLKTRRINRSPALDQLFGYPFAVSEWTYKLFLKHVLPADRKRIRKIHRKSMTPKLNWRVEFRIRRFDGSIRWLWMAGGILRSLEGKALCQSGVIEDITEQKNNHEELLNAKARASLAMEASGVGIWEWNIKTNEVFWDNKMFEIYGLLPQKNNMTTYQTWRQAVVAEDIPEQEAILQETIRNGGISVREFRITGVGDGERRIIQAMETIRSNDHGETEWVVGTNLDITGRKKAETTLEMMRYCVEQSADSVFWIKADGAILYGNAAACASRGYRKEELFGLNIWDLNPDYDAGRWGSHFQELKNRGCLTTESRHRTKDGRIFPVEISANYVHFDNQEFCCSSVRDLTERRNQERQAMRAQRMESIGSLASGIAHDLNNAIAPIMMTTELLRMTYPEKPDYLNAIETSCRHAADMVRQLLTFAKGADGTRVLMPINFNRMLKEMEMLIRSSFPKNIELRIHCETSLPQVLADPTQVHQVLLNLCVNARDAMPKGGKLTLTVRKIEVTAEMAASIHDGKPGQYLALQVGDTGTGIPPEIIDRIFEPFFTTKSPEKGTGLGLSTCIGIMKGHGGFLHVESQLLVGTIFSAYFPISLRSGEATPIQAVPEKFSGNGETILFVDDQFEVRDVAFKILQRLNFKPLIANDGADALIRMAEHHASIRLIITDMHMPRMDGLQFAREARRLSPRIPVLMVSGLLESEEIAQLKLLGSTGQLNKPFSESDLAAALKKLLAPQAGL